MYSEQANQSAHANSAPPAAAADASPSSSSSSRPSPSQTAARISTTSRSLPPDCDLPTDSYLLFRVAACDTDPADLAEELGIRFELLIDWMSAPQTVKRLNTIINARQMIEQQNEQAESSRMLASLASAHDRAVKAKDHVEQRRAAIAYLRFANRPQSRRGHFGCTVGGAGGGERGGSSANRGAGALSLSRFPAQYRTRARFVRTVPILHEAPAFLGPPHTPNPENMPWQTTVGILQRLQDSDNPNDGDGLRTLFNHFTPEWKKKLGVATADDFACTEFDAYHTLLGHTSAVLQPTDYDPAASEDGPILRATVEVNFMDLNAVPRLLTLRFCRSTEAAPWLIDDLQVTSGIEPDPPPAPDAPAPNTS